MPPPMISYTTGMLKVRGLAPSGWRAKDAEWATLSTVWEAFIGGKMKGQVFHIGQPQ